MRKRQGHLWQRIRKALHPGCARVVNDQRPRRWVDLINYLNDRESAEQEVERRAGLTKRRQRLR